MKKAIVAIMILMAVSIFLIIGCMKEAPITKENQNKATVSLGIEEPDELPADFVQQESAESQGTG